MSTAIRETVSPRDRLRLAGIGGASVAFMATRAAWFDVLSSAGSVDDRDLDALSEQVDTLFARLCDERDFLTRTLHALGEDALEASLLSSTVAAHLTESEAARVREILHRDGTVLQTLENILAALPDTLRGLRRDLSAQRDQFAGGTAVFDAGSSGAPCAGAAVSMMMAPWCAICGIAGAIEAAAVC
jgi:hypothetical protein